MERMDGEGKEKNTPPTALADFDGVKVAPEFASGDLANNAPKEPVLVAGAVKFGNEAESTKPNLSTEPTRIVDPSAARDTAHGEPYQKKVHLDGPQAISAENISRREFLDKAKTIVGVGAAIAVTPALIQTANNATKQATETAQKGTEAGKSVIQHLSDFGKRLFNRATKKEPGIIANEQSRIDASRTAINGPDKPVPGSYPPSNTPPKTN